MALQLSTNLHRPGHHIDIPGDVTSGSPAVDPPSPGQHIINIPGDIPNLSPSIPSKPRASDSSSSGVTASDPPAKDPPAKDPAGSGPRASGSPAVVSHSPGQHIIVIPGDNLSPSIPSHNGSKTPSSDSSSSSLPAVDNLSPSIPSHNGPKTPSSSHPAVDPPAVDPPAEVTKECAEISDAVLKFDDAFDKSGTHFLQGASVSVLILAIDFLKLDSRSACEIGVFKVLLALASIVIFYASAFSYYKRFLYWGPIRGVILESLTDLEKLNITQNSRSLVEELLSKQNGRKYWSTIILSCAGTWLVQTTVIVFFLLATAKQFGECRHGSPAPAPAHMLRAFF